MSMKIGNLKLKNNLVLAPMAGVTDRPFRLIAVGEGCGLAVSEMVSAKGLVLGGEKTRSIITLSPEERPAAVQIFGAEPDIMAEAASLLENMGADIVDINMGCPVKKVVNNGAGSALLKNLENIEKILAAVRKRIGIPLTIKIRSGWDHASIVAAEVLKIAEASGVDALTIHPRTKSQFFSGTSDWSLIARLKENAKIPIIGNGDIQSPEDVKKMLLLTGCDGVMIGRGALGNPWTFNQALSYIDIGAYHLPDEEEKHSKVIEHLNLILEHYGEQKGIRLFRKHLGWYSKGVPEASSFRRRINESACLPEIRELIDGFFSSNGGITTNTTSFKTPGCRTNGAFV